MLPHNMAWLGVRPQLQCTIICYARNMFTMQGGGDGLQNRPGLWLVLSRVESAGHPCYTYT
jgi:hypothetical protein